MQKRKQNQSPLNKGKIINITDGVKQKTSSFNIYKLMLRQASLALSEFSKRVLNSRIQVYLFSLSKALVAFSLCLLENFSL